MLARTPRSVPEPQGLPSKILKSSEKKKAQCGIWAKARFISIPECIKRAAPRTYISHSATQTPLFLLCGQVYHYYSKNEQSSKKKMANIPGHQPQPSSIFRRQSPSYMEGQTNGVAREIIAVLQGCIPMKNKARNKNVIFISKLCLEK